MLEAAHEAKAHGIDVAAGYIEPHDRPATQALTGGMEMLPPMMADYKGLKLREFDLDEALKRKPQLILVDELAHTNCKGCRNEKRYQDVKELLRAGISVYTTLNIQHLESLNDLVGSITHIDVRERIPDTVFDHADQVEVVDIEPEELIERMKEGKIYRKEQADRALTRIFSEEKSCGSSAGDCPAKMRGSCQSDCRGGEKPAGAPGLSHRRAHSGLHHGGTLQRQG